jgi:GT2 family glycosyltransferase
VGLVSVVIVNWNCQRFLKDCIDSVYNQIYKDIELLVIDNASTDGSVEFLRREYPQLRLLVNSKNEGFSRAHNRGIRMSSGLYYMPLNPDVVLTENYIAEMVKAIKQNGRIGWASGKLYFIAPDGEKTNRIYSTGHIIFEDGNVVNRGVGEDDRGQYNEGGYIFGANGAAPLYKREMLEDIKIQGEYFEEMFFVYGSDIDLDWRAQLLGWKCFYTPHAVAYHFAEGSRGLERLWMRFQYVRDRYIMILKNAFLDDLLIYFLPRVFIYEFVGYLFRKPIASLALPLSLICFLPQTLWKRHALMKRRRVSKESLKQWFFEKQIP